MKSGWTIEIRDSSNAIEAWGLSASEYFSDSDLENRLTAVIFRNTMRVIYIDCVPPSTTITSHYYAALLRDCVIPSRNAEERCGEGVLVLHDNAPGMVALHHVAFEQLLHPL